MLPSSAAAASAMSAVPSGLLSSTTRMSALGRAARVRRRNSSMFSASTYVGVMTSVRTPRNLAATYLFVAAPVQLIDAAASELLDETEVPLQDLVGPVRSELPGIVRLVPIVPDRREDRDVGRAEVTLQPRARAVGHTRVHLDVVGRGVEVGEHVIEVRVAVRRLAEVGRAHEEPVPGLGDPIGDGQQL